MTDNFSLPDGFEDLGPVGGAAPAPVLPAGFEDLGPVDQPTARMPANPPMPPRRPAEFGKAPSAPPAPPEASDLFKALDLQSGRDATPAVAPPVLPGAMNGEGLDRVADAWSALTGVAKKHFDPNATLGFSPEWLQAHPALNNPVGQWGSVTGDFFLNHVVPALGDYTEQVPYAVGRLAGLDRNTAGQLGRTTRGMLDSMAPGIPGEGVPSVNSFDAFLYGDRNLAHRGPIPPDAAPPAAPMPGSGPIPPAPPAGGGAGAAAILPMLPDPIVPWTTAKPGDIVSYTDTLVGKGFGSADEANAAAAKTPGARVVPDGSGFAVVRPNDTITPPAAPALTAGTPAPQAGSSLPTVPLSAAKPGDLLGNGHRLIDRLPSQEAANQLASQFTGAQVVRTGKQWTVTAPDAAKTPGFELPPMAPGAGTPPAASPASAPESPLAPAGAGGSTAPPMQPPTATLTAEPAPPVELPPVKTDTAPTLTPTQPNPLARAANAAAPIAAAADPRDDILKRLGYTPEDIAKMPPEEKDAEVEEARQNGITAPLPLPPGFEDLGPIPPNLASATGVASGAPSTQKGTTANGEAPGLQRVGQDAAAMQQPPQPGLPGVWGPGDNGMPGVGGVQSLPIGYGATPGTGLLDRPAGWGEGLQPGQLPMGDQGGAVAQPPAVRPAGDVRGAHPNDSGMGAGAGATPANALRPHQQGMDPGASPSPSTGHTSPQRSDIDGPRPHPVNGGLGAGNGSTAQDNQGTAATGGQPRTGNSTPVKAAAPQTLLRFLRNAGGVKDENGELTALGLDRYPGLINNKRGRSLDAARELAAEAGYMGGDIDHAMANTTVADFLDHLARGAQTHSVHDQEAVAQRKLKNGASADADAIVTDNLKALRADLLAAGLSDADLDPVVMSLAAELMYAEHVPMQSAYQAALLRLELSNPAERALIEPASPEIPWDDFLASPAHLAANPDEPWAAADGSKSDGAGAQGAATSGDRELHSGADEIRPRDERPGEKAAGTPRGEAVQDAAQTEPTKGDVTTEPGADNKPQTVIPGAEKIGQGEQAQRGADKALKPKVPQKDVGGLFGDDAKQTDLLDLAKKPAEPKWKPVGVNRDGNPIFEDAKGVRSYTEKGIRVTEPVGVIPGGGIVVDRDHGRDYTPVAETSETSDVEKTAAALLAGNPAVETPAETANIDKTAEEPTHESGGTVRAGTPEVSGAGEPVDAPAAPIGGATDLLSGGDRGAGGSDVRDAGSPHDDGKGSAEGAKGKDRPARANPRGGKRAGDERPDPAAAAGDAGRVEAEKALADRARRNYVIDPERDLIGDGGAKTKVRTNIEAVRIIKDVLAEAREPTVEEKQALVRFVGWGAFAQKLFDPDPRSRNADEWKAERTQLKELLTEEEYAAARKSTLNAHYTSVPVIQGMWDAMRGLGFVGGRALEPAAGVGHFLGLTPEDVRGKTAWTATELDPITGQIAKALYGGSDVHVAGFETLKRPDNYFDLAISNVPFGDFPIRDATYGRPHLAIHDYFFVRSLDKVRPGGMVAFITSRYTMDKLDDRVRGLIAERADLVGAIRLPGGRKGAFAGNAGTEVVTDVIFLRKRVPGEPASTLNPWAETGTVEGGHNVNEYFLANPQMVLGRHSSAGSMYGANEYTVEPIEGQDLRTALAKAASQFPPELRMIPRGPRAASFAPPPAAVDAADVDAGVKEGGFFVQKGGVFVKANGEGRDAGIPKTQLDKVKSLVSMRDKVNALLAAQAAGKGDTTATRKALKKEWESFVKQHGPINLVETTVTKRLNKDGDPVVIEKMPNFGTFRSDPDAYKVGALEEYDAETQTATPAAILDADVLGAPKERVIASPADAIAASLDVKGGIDEGYVSEALGIAPEKVADHLGDLAFTDPNGDKLVVRDEYLSGDVVGKLEDAAAAAKDDPRYQRNVEALKKVQPTPLTHHEVQAQFGAAWVPTDVYEDFLRDVLGVAKPSVKRVPVTGEYRVEFTGTVAADARSKFGTRRAPVEEVFKAAINLRRVTVFDETDDGKRVLNVKETDDANNRLDQLKAAFAGDPDSGQQGWIWKDDNRRSRLLGLYNRTFNSRVLRNYDGAHLTFPGMAATIATPKGPVAFELRPHQKDAVWRMLQKGNTLLDHVVGAGKTFTMIAGGMEMRRLGIVRKPAYVVPNHMLEQFSREFLQAYPAAKILVAQKDEMTKDARRAFAAKSANGDWDAIIITHDAFGRIPMSPEWQAQHIARQVQQLEDVIREMKSDKDDKRTVKQMEKAKARLEARAKDLLNAERKDRGVTFEEMGIDHLFVDEAHLFKNLSFVTKMQRVKGLSQGNSQRAEDLYLKMRWLDSNRPGRAGVFATGTPISNTIAEMFTMQRFLQERLLEQMGLDNFDAWASTFGQTVTNMALSADGRSLKAETSFSKFVNIPELVAMFSEVADTRTADMLNLPRPELAKRPDGNRGIKLVEAELSPEEDRLIQAFVARAESLKGQKVVKGGDNMLKVVTDGRKVATDGRLFDPSLPFNENGKIAKAVSNIVKHYKEGTGPAKAQIVFLDMGTPSAKNAPKKTSNVVDILPDDEEEGDTADETSKINLYEDIRERLMERGIPKAEIAFIHEAKDDRAKGALFAKVRSGKVRVLIGSTGKMGVGTNVQRYLIAMHHIDAPYKPAEVEQRDGRILRQGNENKEVHIYRYVTARSFDAFMWQKLDTKSRFIGQLKSGAKGIRTAEDIDNPLPEAAEMKAAAAGDPRIMEAAELERKIKVLQSQRNSFAQQKDDLERAVRQGEAALEGYRARIGPAKALASKIKNVGGDQFSIDLSPLGKGTFSKREDAGNAIRDRLVGNANQFYVQKDIPLASYGGLDIRADVVSGWDPDLNETIVKVSPFVSEDGLRIEARNPAILSKGADMSGFTRRLDTILTDAKNGASNVAKQIERAESDVARSKAALAEQGTWPKAKELAALQVRLKEINEALTKPAAAPKAPDTATGTDPKHSSFGEASDKPALYHDIESVLRLMGGKHFKRATVSREPPAWVASEEAIRRSGGDGSALPFGAMNPETGEIWIREGSGAEVLTAVHEITHVLEAAGTFSPAERRLLDAETPRLREMVARRFGATAEQMAAMTNDEVQTYATQIAYQDKDALRGQHIGVRRALERAADTLTRLKNLIQGRGFQTLGDFFNRVHSGELGQRAAGPRTAAQEKIEPRLSMFGQTGGTSRFDDAYTDKPFFPRMVQKVKNAVDVEKQIENWVDMHRPVQTMQEDVAGRLGKQSLPDHLNPYLAKRTMPGKIKNQTENFEARIVDKVVDIMRRANLSMHDIGLYALAKHAPERNALMDQRDPKNNGTGSSISDQEARDIEDSLRRQGKWGALENLGKIAADMREFNLRLSVASGLMSKATADELRQQFQHYYPLQGWEDESLAPDSNFFGEARKLGPTGPEFRHAFGRRTLPENPFVGLIHQTYRTIERAERNKAAKVVYRLMRQLDPADLKDLARIDQGEMVKTLDKATGLMVWREKSPRQSDPATLTAKLGGVPHYVTFNDQRTGEAVNRITGSTLITPFRQILSMYRYVKSAWTHLALPFLEGHFLTRYPLELFLNRSVDGGFSKGAKAAATAYPLVGKASRALFKALRMKPAERAAIPQRIANGTASETDKWIHFHDEAAEAGAYMNFTAFNDLDRISRSLGDDVAKFGSQPLRAARGRARHVFEAWDKVTNILDSAERLAVYRQRREEGASVSRAALAAREATVDFNLRGKFAPILGIMRAFGNVTVQTAAWPIKAARRNPKGLAKVLGSVMFAASAVTLWNYEMGGTAPDGVPYIEKVSSFTRDKQPVLLIPGWKDAKGEPHALHAPFPYFYNFAYQVGVAGTQLALKAKGIAKEDAGTIGARVFHAGLAAMTPLGDEAGFFAKFMPEFMLPAAHVATNEDWKGHPVHTQWERDGLARSAQGKATTGDFWKGTASTVNKVTGGDRRHSGWVDMYPEDYRELFGFVTSAWTRTTGQTTDALGDVMAGKVPEPENNPLVSPFVSGQKGYNSAARGRYYDAKKEAAKAAARLSKAKKEHDWEAVSSIHANEQPLLNAHDVFKGSDKEIKELYARRDALDNQKSLSAADRAARQKAFDEQIVGVMERAQRRAKPH